jgi:hypothetical protein
MYQSPKTLGLKDNPGHSFSKLGQSSRSRSLGQKTCYQKKGILIMHLYLKYQSP